MVKKVSNAETIDITSSSGSESQLSKVDIAKISDSMGEAEWYAKERINALNVYNSTPMPTVSDEAWRRTDIRSVDWEKFALGTVESNKDDGKVNVPNHLLKPLVGEEHGGQIVISGGQVIQQGLDNDASENGVVFADFISATKDHGELFGKYISKLINVSDGKHAAMAGALVDQGVFVYVPAGVSVKAPLHSVLWLSGDAHFSRVVVVVENGGSLTYVHELASDGGNSEQLHAGTVEVFVGDNAELKFVELQSLSENCYHFSHEKSQVGRDGRLDWVFSAIGSKLTKSFLDLDLVGNGAWGRMSGFYFAAGKQHMDHDTQQNHRAEGQTSDLLFKGALRDESRSVWQGMINVEPGAQKTDGFQANRNLLLARNARADSIPGLEIQADDVRCTHAATISRLEEEHLFYLMSRGIEYEEARKVVVDGFFDPIMERIPFDGVRERLKESVVDKMA
ncbi:MAG: Fe-S cluster assembly protein SufD [Anaerolineales bacterium]